MSLAQEDITVRILLYLHCAQCRPEGMAHPVATTKHPRCQGFVDIIIPEFGETGYAPFQSVQCLSSVPLLLLLIYTVDRYLS